MATGVSDTLIRGTRHTVITISTGQTTIILDGCRACMCDRIACVRCTYIAVVAMEVGGTAIGDGRVNTCVV